MEATASGALLRRVPFAPRRAAGDGGMPTPARNRPVIVRVGNKFEDQGHLRYYAAAATPARCGPKREEKRRIKLVKGLERDLSALYSMGFDAAKGQDQCQQISEAAELLLAQLTKLRAEAKEMKQRRKQEKAAMKAAKMKDRAATESSSESSDSECEAVVKMSSSSLRTVSAAVSDPVTAAALQTEDVIEEAKSNLALNIERQCCSRGAEVALTPTEGKIEVCMGGKCKKSGAMELMAEFEKKVGVEGAQINQSIAMARFKNKRRKYSTKPPAAAKKQQPNVDQVTGDKIPKSFVFSRGKLPGPLKQLELDIRKIMLPYTAIKLKEKKRNNLKDFLNVAGPMGVTHFLMLSNPKSIPHLRVARTPQGPTLTFEIREYVLAADIARAQIRPRCPKDLFNNSPLVVLSGFGSGGQHLKLTTIMFQNIFPAIDINTVKLSSCQRIVLLNYNSDTKLIDFRHYSIRLQPVGVSRRIRKFVQNHQVPDLRNLQDVSDFVTKAGYGSESEADEEAATVSLTSDVGRVNRASNKSAVKLQEIGPRMTLQLVKIEEGLCSGGIIFSEYEGKGAADLKKGAQEEE